MALINPKCIGEPELCSRSDAPMSERQGTTTANRQNRQLKIVHFHHELTNIPNIQDDDFIQLLTKIKSQSVTLTSVNRKKEY